MRAVGGAGIAIPAEAVQGSPPPASPPGTATAGRRGASNEGRLGVIWSIADRCNSPMLSELIRGQLVGFAHYFNVRNPLDDEE